MLSLRILESFCVLVNCHYQAFFSLKGQYSPSIRLKNFSIKRNCTEVNRGRRYPASYGEKNNLTMLAVSCMSPQEVIRPTKFITCRYYCIPSITSYKAAFIYSCKMLCFGVSQSSHISIPKGSPCSRLI